MEITASCMYIRNTGWSLQADAHRDAELVSAVGRKMAGLEALYTCVADKIQCPQDAVVCLVHWEMIKNGYRCIGSGFEPSSRDKKSELLPADWSSNKELYSLRYRSSDTDTMMVLKAIAVDSTLIFNLMNSGTNQVSYLMVNISDHVNADQLHTFDSVFRDADDLSEKVKYRLLPRPEKAPESSRQEEGESSQRRQEEDSDPLRHGLQPHWLAFWEEMILDPVRFGFPHFGIPDILPPGAIPPEAHFDPIGPLRRHGLGFFIDPLHPERHLKRRNHFQGNSPTVVFNAFVHQLADPLTPLTPT
ncbi:proteasome inhibitor PI31 subunit-like isoform X1 [Xiphophorus couchianus]|uniref:proteasome inhibitor PI31 subunit-like isoform X1 n=1 Tax=Xiphophorus couchianus TaxID=32473 RepID=UPI00101633D9|nr:proteasome inhibitor PI31 subunit-like isoform X1 [Xiphophorus couchianus]